MTKSKILQKIDIFISSPGDVFKERQIANRVINRLNRMQYIASCYTLKPLAYEREVPAAIGKHPQMTVDHYMMQADKSDLFICILWHRMGTPVIHEETGEQFQSGTEYEFVSAYRANQQHGRPHMLLYRSTKSIPHDSDLEQVTQVQAFFKRFEGEKPEYKGLYKTFRTDKQFEEMLFHDLDAVLSKGLLEPDLNNDRDILSLRDSVSNTTVGTQHHDKKLRLKEMLADHHAFLHDRLSSFVGRVRELEEIHQRINTLVPTGGYLTITGQAGQGKSCMIAKLVQEYSPDITAHHFIPFTPGPDYQVSLLRDVMARLILKYDLSDLHVASVNRTALRDAFPKVLKEVVAKSGQELIFIDGLDQLEADANGERDLSFLPNNPPQGVVFVLGTRPDDTLRPLELRKPRFEYCLPNLSREDFVLLLEHRGVKLNQSLIDQFYGAMQKNALYLDLVAKELAQEGAAQPEEIIKRVADNPDDIFTLSIERLQRKPNDVEWREVLKPILGVLLVAREPLTARHLRQILEVRHIPGIDDYRLRKGLMRLGGLVADDGRQRYLLFHLKLYNYLLQDESNPQKDHIFAMDEEQGWHKAMVDWCEMGPLATIWEDVKRDVAEQGRREYARQHYITHLYRAREWQKLFAVLDEGTYGQAKIHYDLSTRSFAQDLDLGRRAAAWEEWTLEEAVAALPCLWRYTLLQCSLAGRADNYSLEMFEALVALKREREALGLAELLTNQNYKVRALVMIAEQVSKQPGGEQENVPILIKAYEVAQGIEEKNEERIKALGELSRALTHTQQWERAETIAHAIEDRLEKAATLSELSRVLAYAQQWEQAEEIAHAIEDKWRKDEVLSELSKMLAQIQQWERAETMIHNIGDWRWKAKALQELGTALAQNQKWKQAEVIWFRAEEMAHSLEENWKKSQVLQELANILAQARRWEWATRIWSEAEISAHFISVSWERTKALKELGTALAQAQQLAWALKIWAEAETAAQLIGVSQERTKALKELGTALAQAQQLAWALKIWAEAETAAHMIKSGKERGKALSELSKALAHAKQWDRAELVAFSIEETWQKSKALGQLSQVLVHAQHWEKAEEVWAKAEKLTRLIESRQEKAEALGELSKALTHAQQWKQAEMIARSVELEKEKAEALSRLSLALTQAQEWVKAQEIACTIELEKEKAEALSRLSLALTQAQEWAKAEEIILSIEEILQKIKGLILLKAALIDAGQWQYARVIERRIEKAILRVVGNGKKNLQELLELSKVLTQLKQWEHAKMVWEELEIVWENLLYSDSDFDEDEKTKALLERGEMLIQARQYDLAISFIPSILPSREGLDGLGMLSDDLVKAQQWHFAEKLWIEAERNYKDVGTYEYVSEKVTTLLNLASVLLESKQKHRARAVLTKAEKAIQSTEPGVNKTELLVEFSRALIQAKQWRHAEAIAQSIEQGLERAEVLSELSRALTYEKQWAYAKKVANSIVLEAGDEKRIALVELWIALAQIQGREQADGLFVKAEEMARSIGSKWRKIEALQLLSMSLARMWEWKRAIAVACTMDESEDKAETLLKLSLILAQEHEWDLAVSAVRAIELERQRAEALRGLTALLFQNKMYKKAEMIWTEALKVARSIKDLRRDEVLCQFSKVLAQEKYWTLAEEAARSIESEEERIEALRNLSIVLTQAQQWEQAELIMNSIEEVMERAKALRYLAISLAEAGKHEQLTHLVQRSWLNSDTVPYAIKLLPMTSELISLKPEIGMPLCDSFAWVDKFLKG